MRNTLSETELTWIIINAVDALILVSLNEVIPEGKLSMENWQISNFILTWCDL